MWQLETLAGAQNSGSVSEEEARKVVQMNEYPLIADHGLIGDLQTAALVSTEGTLDWFCSPRFDSPSIFASLLDRSRGGHFSTRPLDQAFATKQLYLPDTAVLITRFLTEGGVGELMDFMPVTGDSASEQHRLVRMLRCVRGQISFDIEVAPRFDYGRRRHHLNLSDDGATFDAGETRLALSLIREEGDNRPNRYEATDDGDLHASLRLEQGQMRGVVLETGPDVVPRKMTPAEAQRLLDDTALLARLGKPIHLCRSLARRAGTVGHHLEAPDLCADGGPRGSPHCRTAGTGRRGTQLGLPVHLDTRCLLFGSRPHPDGFRRSPLSAVARVPCERLKLHSPLNIMYH
jgi:hypothetical protein